MPIYAAYLLGFVLYLVSTWVAYNGKSILTIIAGGAIGAVTSTLWFYVVYRCKNDTEIYTSAFAWDCMILFSYAVFPFAFSGVLLSKLQLFGCFLMLIGAILVR